MVVFIAINRRWWHGRCLQRTARVEELAWVAAMKVAWVETTMLLLLTPCQVQANEINSDNDA
jgi:hypothetical protein